MASFAEKSRALIEALAASELIAAFEGGEDRESVLKRARRLRSEPAPDRWDGLPYGLVTRLLQDRDGADVVIPTRVGDDLRVKDDARGLLTAGGDLFLTSFRLLVFDEQIALLRSYVNYNNADIHELDVIYCSRSSAFEICLPKMHENEPLRDYYRRLLTWRQLDQTDIPVVTPTRGSFISTGTRFRVERQAACMEAIEAICQECGTHGLVACVWSPLVQGREAFDDCVRFRNLAERCFDDDAARRAAAQAAFQELLLKLYSKMETELRLDDLPPVGALRRRAVRGPHARFRALVLQGRATCLRDGFLYEAAPARVFRLVVSFL